MGSPGRDILKKHLELAREKTKEPNAGGYHVSLFGDRRPDLYSPLATSDS